MALGLVSVIGPVELRGVKIAQENTLFPGDHLIVGNGGYAKILLANGHKLEVGPNSDLTLGFAKEKDAIQIHSGNVDFSSQTSSPLNIVVGPYEIASNVPVSGTLAIVPDDFIEIHVLTGSLVVRNGNTKESAVVPQGSLRLLSSNPTGSKKALAQLASNLPPTLPPLPSGGGSDVGVWSTGWFRTLLIFAGLGTTATVTATVARHGGTADSAQLQAVQTAISVAQDAETAAAQIAQTASQTSVAIAQDTDLRPSIQASMSVQAQDIRVRALTSAQRIASLRSQLQQLQVRLAGAVTDSSAQNQTNILIQQLNSELSDLNNLIGNLGSLVAQAINNGIPNVPKVHIEAIPPVAAASKSTP